MTPDAALAALLERRADIAARIRRFFAERGVLEVDTPALSAAAVSDPNVASVRAHAAALGPATVYLHTSPEFAMKRVLAAVRRDCYQICRVFRDGELGRWHEPEFVMLEWYRIGFDEHALMAEVSALLGCVLGGGFATRKLTYAEAFRDSLGIDAHADTPSVTADLVRALEQRGVEPPPGTDRHGLLDLALGAVVAPGFDRGQATFLYDYPADQAALAETNPGEPPTAARFEVFVGGLELGNGFRELTDAREQRRRFERDQARRRELGLSAVPLDEAFLGALERGLPACAGIALGFDRLVAVATGAGSLAEATVFPHAGRGVGD